MINLDPVLIPFFFWLVKFMFLKKAIEMLERERVYGVLECLIEHIGICCNKVIWLDSHHKREKLNGYCHFYRCYDLVFIQTLWGFYYHSFNLKRWLSRMFALVVFWSCLTWSCFEKKHYLFNGSLYWEELTSKCLAMY